MARRRRKWLRAISDRIGVADVARSTSVRLGYRVDHARAQSDGIGLTHVGSPTPVVTASAINLVDPTTTPGTQPLGQTSGWALTASEEFTGSITTVDAGLGLIKFRSDGPSWATWYPDWPMFDEPAGNHTNYNYADYYTPSKMSLSGGVLNLRADKQVTFTGLPYTSGMIQSINFLTPTEGYFEARIKTPQGQPTGFWPAFWLTSATYDTWNFEIDIFERYANSGTGHYNNVYDGSWDTVVEYVADYTQYHTYAVKWTATNVTFYLDGVQKHVSTKHSSAPQYLILNAGARAPENPTFTSASVDFDYVRVWKASTTPTTLPGWLRDTSNTGLASVGLTTGDLTTYTGGMTVSTPQYRKNIVIPNGYTMYAAAGAKFTQCRISGAKLGTLLEVNASGVEFIDCDIIGSLPASTGESRGILSEPAYTNTTVRNCRMTGFTIYLWLNGGGVIDQCYLYAPPAYAPGPHLDGITRRYGTTALTVTNTRVDVPNDNTTWVTGACFLQPTYGNMSNVTVENCFMEGGGNCFTIEYEYNNNGNIYHCTGTVVRNNRILSYGGANGAWGPASVQAGSTSVWTDNYLYVNDPANDYKGAAVTI